MGELVSSAACQRDRSLLTSLRGEEVVESFHHAFADDFGFASGERAITGIDGQPQPIALCPVGTPGPVKTSNTEGYRLGSYIRKSAAGRAARGRRSPVAAVGR